MNVKIIGAEVTVSNLSGGAWKDSTQVAASRAQLFKASYSNLSAADLYAWFFNTAAGTSNSTSPVMVRPLFAGSADTWDFGDSGKLFTAGIYIVFSNAPPSTPASDASASLAGDDQVILDCDVRLV